MYRVPLVGQDQPCGREVFEGGQLGLFVPGLGHHEERCQEPRDGVCVRACIIPVMYLLTGQCCLSVCLDSVLSLCVSVCVCVCVCVCVGVSLCVSVCV